MCRSDRKRLEEDLVSRYDRMSRYLGKNFRFSHVDKEDVLQKAFLAAIKNLDSLRDEEKLENWLTRIVRHTALNYKKVEKRIADRIVDVDDLETVLPS